MNPYEKLAQIIEKWQSAGGSASNRRFVRAEGVEKWSSVREAFKVMAEVDTLLESEPDSDVLLIELWKFLIQPERAWNNTNGQVQLSKANLAHLKTLARHHDRDPLATRKLSESEVKTLLDTLETLKEEIVEYGQSLGAAGARFLLLIDSCITLVKQGEADPEAVRAKAEQLVGAAAMMTPFIPPEKRNGFWATVAGAVSFWMGNAASGATGNVIAEVFMEALPSGS